MPSLPEDLDSVPNTHMAAHNLWFQGIWYILHSPQVQGMHVVTEIHMKVKHTHTNKIKNVKSMPLLKTTVIYIFMCLIDIHISFLVIHQLKVLFGIILSSGKNSSTLKTKEYKHLSDICCSNIYPIRFAFSQHDHPVFFIYCSWMFHYFFLLWHMLLYTQINHCQTSRLWIFSHKLSSLSHYCSVSPSLDDKMALFLIKSLGCLCEKSI